MYADPTASLLDAPAEDRPDRWDFLCFFPPRRFAAMAFLMLRRAAARCRTVVMVSTRNSVPAPASCDGMTRHANRARMSDHESRGHGINSGRRAGRIAGIARRVKGP